MKKRLFSLVAILLAGCCSEAMAQDMVTGQYEYMNHCASCHGENGQGDGPLIEILKDPVPDLTVLSRNNEGMFPFHETLMVIDGRKGLRGHGNYMPVWGDTFERQEMTQAADDRSYMIAQGRLLSLVEYLVTIQQD